MTIIIVLLLMHETFRVVMVRSDYAWWRSVWQMQVVGHHRNTR